MPLALQERGQDIPPSVLPHMLPWLGQRQFFELKKILLLAQKQELDMGKAC